MVYIFHIICRWYVHCYPLKSWDERTFVCAGPMRVEDEISFLAVEIWRVMPGFPHSGRQINSLMKAQAPYLFTNVANARYALTFGI